MYPRAHSRLTFFGDAAQSAEEWQTGIRLDGTQIPNTAALAAALDSFSTRIWQYMSAPSRNRLVGVKWAPQGTDGKYGDNGEAVEYFLPTPLSGSGSGGYPQIALCLSLRTSRSRGYASNGRMYIPSTYPVGGDGMLDENTCENSATSAANFVAEINALGLGDVSVMSNVGAGRIEAVTAVRVGRVMDTQRRRRNQLPELYALPAPVPS